jgi:hypothetical protein
VIAVVDQRELIMAGILSSVRIDSTPATEKSKKI